MAKQRLEWIDSIRGVAIITVVFFHSVEGNDSIMTETARAQFDYVEWFLRNFGLPLFFFASGLFLERWAQRPFKEAMASRVNSLLVPFLVWSAIVGGLYLALTSIPQLSGAINNPITVKKVLLSPINPLVHLWFLQVLFLHQVVFYGLRKIANSVVITGIAVLIFYLPHDHDPASLLRSYFEFANNFIWMMFGVICAPYILPLEFGKRHIPWLAIIFAAYLATDIWAAALGIRNHGAWQADFRWVTLAEEAFLAIRVSASEAGFWCVTLLVVTSCLSLWAWPLFCMWIRGSRAASVLEYLGRMSMVIYLVHALVTPATRIFMRKLLHVDNVYVIVVVSMIAGLIVPLLVHPITGKMKLNRWLFGR